MGEPYTKAERRIVYSMRARDKGAQAIRDELEEHGYNRTLKSVENFIYEVHGVADFLDHELDRDYHTDPDVTIPVDQWFLG